MPIGALAYMLAYCEQSSASNDAFGDSRAVNALLLKVWNWCHSTRLQWIIQFVVYSTVIQLCVCCQIIFIKYIIKCRHVTFDIGSHSGGSLGTSPLLCLASLNYSHRGPFVYPEKIVVGNENISLL